MKTLTSDGDYLVFKKSVSDFVEHQTVTPSEKVLVWLGHHGRGEGWRRNQGGSSS